MPAKRDSARGSEGAPDSFGFLGLIYCCDISRAGKFKLERRTSKKKLRAKLHDIKDWFHSVLSTRLSEVWTKLNAKLRGHYQYYGINDNWPDLMVFREHIRRFVKRWIHRRH